MATYRFLVVIAAGQQQALRRVAAPAQEGRDADCGRVHPQGHQNDECLDIVIIIGNTRMS